MPKKNVGYEDAMGSIFDFVFKEAQKPPNKVKPVQVTGLDGASGYADAVTAVLENPLLFVNKTTVDALNDLVNPDLVKVTFGQDSRKDRVGVRLLNVKDVLSGDMSFIDKQFATIEANRKMGRLTWAGASLGGFIAADWARKNNLDFDTQMAFMGAGKQISDPEENLITKNRQEKLAKEHIKSPLTKEQYISRYEGYLGGRTEAEKAYNNKYLPSLKGGFKGGLDDYGFLERDNLENKAKEALRNGDKKQAENYLRAASLSEALHSVAYADKYIASNKKTLKSYASKIKNLSKNPTPADLREIETIRGRMKDIDKNLRVLQTQRAATSLGKLEGMVGSVRGLYEYVGGGKLIPAILNGDFFDENKNTVFNLQPTVSKSILIRDSKGLEFIAANGKPLEIKYHIAKSGNNALSSAYNKMMTELYYYTPASFLKNLSTGERTAYFLKKQQDKMMKAFGSKGLDMEKLFGPDGDTYLASLSSVFGAKDLAVIQKFFRSNKAQQELALSFAKIGNLKNKISGFFLGDGPGGKGLAGVMYQMRNKFGTWLTKKWADGAAKDLVETWMKSGGIKILIEGIKTSIKAALGATTGGLGAIVGFAVDIAADVVIKLGYNISKPFIKFFTTVMIFSVVGMVGLIFLIGSIFGHFSHVAPTQIKQWDPNFTVSAGSSGVPFDGEPLPDGVSCLLGTEGGYSCTQGPGGSHSHSRLPNAIDVGYLGYFYAPTFCGDGNCIILENGDYPGCNGYAGGQVIFTAEYGGHTYKFKLVHVEMDPALSEGDELSAGQIVARIMTLEETGTACSTGAHLHLEMWYDGATVDPSSILREGSESGGFGCGLSSCGD